MLNLNFPILDASIQLDNSTILVLESPAVFSKIVQQIYEYKEDGELKIFDHKYFSLKESEILVITDILGYSLNSASMLKLIYSDLESQLNEKPDIKSEIERLSIEVNKLIATQLIEHELHLESQEPALTSLFSSFTVKIATHYQTVFEKSLDLLHVFKYLRKKKLLVFVNICSYLTEEEVKVFLEEISLLNIFVLFIEPNIVYDVHQFVVDSDFCLIQPK